MATTKYAPVPTFPSVSGTRLLARVLLVDADPASRLTLQTVLRAGGYGVDTAATVAEALGKLDAANYSLVLSDLHMESPEAGLQVISHARAMKYRPATGLLSCWHEHYESVRAAGTVLIEPENIPELLEQIAHMIGQRASRQLTREMRRN